MLLCRVSGPLHRRHFLLLRLPSFRSVSTDSAAPELYDVVCVGGGPAGLSLLSAIRSIPETSHLRIALVEAQKLKSTSPSTQGFSNRCSSLTPASITYLKRIGAWEHLDQSRVQAYNAIKVWDGVSGSSVTFDPSELPVGPGALIPRRRDETFAGGLASMVENSNLTSALVRSLGNTAVDIYDDTRVKSIAPGQDTTDFDLSSWPIVELENSKTLAARLLVGADGANSPVRAFAEITARGWDYNQHGVVATLHLASGNEEPRTAYQRFLPSGPVALLPMPGDRATLVWSITPERAAELKALRPEDFAAMVNAAFRLLPSDIDYMHSLPHGHAEEVAWRTSATLIDMHTPEVVGVQDGSIASFPLRMRHADTYVGERVALIGDAAHTIHPLAGQGLNQGLGDAKALARQVAYSVTVGRDIGSSFALDDYNAARWATNNAMLGAVDKLHKLYSASSGPVVWARSLGLDAVDKLGWLKTFFMKRAAGS